MGLASCTANRREEVDHYIYNYIYIFFVLRVVFLLGDFILFGQNMKSTSILMSKVAVFEADHFKQKPDLSLAVLELLFHIFSLGNPW